MASHESSLPDRLLRGTESSATDLDRMFRDKLCELVKRQMSRRYQQREGPEDVVQDVLMTFFRRNANGEFHFEDTGAVWGLLQRIAHCKILKHVAHHEAQCRNPDREEYCEVEEVATDDLSGQRAQLLGDALEAALSGGITLEPEIYRLQLHGYTIDEIVKIALRSLPSPYPEILQLRLQGKNDREIAETLGCGQQAVGYRVKRIEERLKRHLRPDS